MDLAIGCRLELHCERPTPVLALVHPHASLTPELLGPERVRLDPERTFELLTDRSGNRWSRLIASGGTTRFGYDALIRRPEDAAAPLSTTSRCPVAALPIDAYAFLNASPYCDTAALMPLAWRHFGRQADGWGLVQAICDWVNGRLRFDHGATHPEKTASATYADGAGVCRDYAHLAISLCRCLNIPARYCTGYQVRPGGADREEPVDFTAWFEAFLGDRWHSFDARHPRDPGVRVLIGRGRDAADVPFLRSFGAHRLLRFTVVSDVLAAPPPQTDARETDATETDATETVRQRTPETARPCADGIDRASPEPRPAVMA